MLASSLEDANSGAITQIQQTVFAGYCTASQMAIALGISIRTLHRFVVAGMPSKKVGRHRWFKPDAVARWLNDLPPTRKAA